MKSPAIFYKNNVKIMLRKLEFSVSGFKEIIR